MEKSARGGLSGGPGISLYDVVLTEVVKIQPYGIFVKIPGCRRNGLVHKSQMSRTKVENPEDMVEVGERVWCKVITVEENGEKLGLSMKVVSQTNGKDLDPNHVQSSLDEQRRKTSHTKETPKIELGAVLDTTCKKCGGKGHFSQDCFYTPGGDKYDLLPSVDFLVNQAEVEDKTEGMEKHYKKKKDKKHKKKKKKHKKQQSDDEEDESKGRKRKKHKKSEKKRISNKGSSVSESSSDTDMSDYCEHVKRRRSHSKSDRRRHSSESGHDESRKNYKHSGHRGEELHNKRRDIKNSGIVSSKRDYDRRDHKRCRDWHK